MSFDLTTKQLDLKARARDLAAGIIAKNAAEVDKSEQYPWENVKALKEAGFMGMTIPTELGGPGLNFLDANLVVEEMASYCGPTGRIAVEANMGAISAVVHYGTKTQKRLAADLVLDGDKPAICITEPEAGSAASQMTTRAEKRGDKYIINGKKWWSSGAMIPSCKMFIVMGKTNPEQDRHHQQSMIIVPSDSPGVKVVRPLSVFGYLDAPHGHAEIELNDVRVSAKNLILE